MTDDELASLRRRSSKLTLMPYSYFKLSSQSGYGAGNHAPAYFELLWEQLNERRPRRTAAPLPVAVVRHLREAGTHRSTAEVIEGVRLARTLSALHDGLPRRSPTCGRRRHAHRPRRARHRRARRWRASTSARPSANCPRA